MTTFILKKYEEKKDEVTTPEQNQSEEEQDDKMTITVMGSISEIVAKALNKALAHQVDIEVQEGSENATVKAVSAEDINASPLDTFNSIQKDDAVFIHSTGFNTKEQEWFLSNIGNKTDNVFYTVESFINYIKMKLNIK